MIRRQSIKKDTAKATYLTGETDCRERRTYPNLTKATDRQPKRKGKKSEMETERERLTRLILTNFHERKIQSLHV